MIKERNKAQEVLSENKNDKMLQNFKILRNKLTKRLKTDKIQWQRKKLENFNNESGTDIFSIDICHSICGP